MRIRIVGCGNRGITLIGELMRDHELVLNDTGDAQVEHLVRHLRDGGLKAEAESDKPCDLTWIATPVGTHWSAALPYLERGEPVCVEKPLCLSISDLDRFIEADRAGSWICVGQNARFRAAARMAKILSMQGVAVLHCYKYRGRGELYYETRQGCGVLAEQAQHCIDLLTFIVSEEPMSVSAVGITSRHDMGAEDTVAATIIWPRTLGTVTATTAGAPYDKFGDMGLHIVTRHSMASYTDELCSLHKLEGGVTEIPHGGIFPDEILLAAQERTTPPVTVASCVNGIKVLHAAYASMASGRVEPFGTVYGPWQ